jgi:histone H3/H4
VRALVKSKGKDVKMSKQVFSIIQYHLEAYIVGILHRSNLAAVHAGRVKLLPDDIDFIMALEDQTLPLSLDVDDVGESDEGPVDTKSITGPALQRLARQGGVKTMSSECIDVIRNLLLLKTSIICDAVIVVNNQGGTKTIMSSDIYNAMEYLGIRLAKAEKFGEPNAN